VGVSGRGLGHPRSLIVGFDAVLRKVEGHMLGLTRCDGVVSGLGLGHLGSPARFDAEWVSELHFTSN
jgi:hypothetical protein